MLSYTHAQDPPTEGETEPEHVVLGLEKGLPVDGGGGGVAGGRDPSEQEGGAGDALPRGKKQLHEPAPWPRVWERISRSKPRTKQMKKTAKTEVISTVTGAIKIHTPNQLTGLP